MARPSRGLDAQNRPAMFLHWFALNELGRAWCRSTPICVRPSLPTSYSTVVPALPSVRKHTQKLRQAAGGCAVVTEAFSHPTGPSAARNEAPGPASECALLYTSGTTGKPKGCALSNDYFLRCGRWYTEIGGLCTLRPGEDRLITPLPMTHMNAMACSTLAMVMTGGCIIPLDRFHPRRWWQAVRETRRRSYTDSASCPRCCSAPNRRRVIARMICVSASALGWTHATTPRSNSGSASR